MKLCGRALFLPAFLSFAAISAGAIVTSAPARAQAASEFSPLPTTPAKPRPQKPMPAPQAETPPTPPAPATPAPAEAKVPEPVVPAPNAPAAAESAPPAPEIPANVAPARADKAEQKKEIVPAEKKTVEKSGEKEKKKAAAKEENEEKSSKSAKREEKEKEKDITEPKPARVELRFASKLPPDDHGPRAIEFIGKCADNYDKCIDYVREQAEKIPDGDVCLQVAADQQQVTERVRKFITLRPGIQDQAANRMITEALYTIYPCTKAVPERTAKKK